MDEVLNARQEIRAISLDISRAFEQLQTIRPVQASQQNNSQQMTLAGLSPWREYGGAGHSEGGLRPTYLSPSHLSPLPVSVHTHSLNLQKTQFSPNLLFFCFYFYFTSPLKIRPLTPFIVIVRLTYRLRAYSQPLRSLPGGE